MLWKKKDALRRPDDPTPNAPAAPGREPSTLLAFIAGDFAAEAARLWPAPHTEFLLAPAAKRHLVCLALSLERATNPLALRASLTGSLKAGIKALVDCAPEGLGRALGRLGERAWTAGDYRRLLERLSDPRTAKRLRHAELIEAREVRVLSTLPPVVITAGAGRFALTEDQSALLAECFEVLVRCHGPDAAMDTASRWANAGSAETLFKRVDEDLSPREVPPPHPGTARLAPLSTRRALANAGRRYRNCLRDRILDGYVHHYEWLGEPGGVVSIVDDFVYGWRLEEALAADNRPLPALARREVEAELAAMGVHVGRSAWELKRLLGSAARPTFVLPRREEEVDHLFGA